MIHNHEYRHSEEEAAAYKLRGQQNKMNTTIYDVAREAGVSMATVSRVVNGNPNVKPTTRKKFWKQLNA